MDYNKAALEMHEAHHGKVGTVSKGEVKTRGDLAPAHTPGVAGPGARPAPLPRGAALETRKPLPASSMVATGQGSRPRM